MIRCSYSEQQAHSWPFVFCTDLDQQSLPSEPEEALSRELGEGEETDLAPPEDLLGSPQALSQQDLDLEEEDVASKEALLQLSSPLHFVNTHFNGAGSPTDGVMLSPGGPAETLSLEAVSGDLTTPPSTLSPLLGLAESDPVPVPSPSVLPSLPQDSPQPLPAPEEEEALTTEDFELLDQGELEQLNAEMGLGPETCPEPPDASPPPPLGPDTPSLVQSDQEDQAVAEP